MTGLRNPSAHPPVTTDGPSLPPSWLGPPAVLHAKNRVHKAS
ncbi:hypothetical protein QFZ66_004341 [Streptomyces sp. B4I13]|nr:hypothetical protein [Streptomyces sp. B4I13]